MRLRRITPSEALCSQARSETPCSSWGLFTSKEPFYRTVSELMQQHRVKLYRLDDLNPLLSDIEANRRLHASQ